MNGTPDTPPDGSVRDWLDFRAKTRGPFLAYLFADGTPPLCWRELRDRARELARDLTQQGLACGDGVAVMAPNGYDAVLCLFGLLYGGFRVTMINLIAGPEAIAYALDHCEARHALVTPDQQDLFDATRPVHMAQLPLPRGPVTDRDIALHPLGGDDAALVMYTSGTTGRPKGVVHTHASLLAGGWTPTLAHALTPEDRALCVLPMYHINGLCVTVMGALVSGGSVVLAPRFSASAFWDQVETHDITWFSVVPTIVSHLLHGAAEPSPQVKARLRFGRCASSPLAPEVQEPFEARFGVPIVETMGLTETAAQILSNPLPPGQRKIGSPGIAIGNAVAILRPDLSHAGAHEKGEIAVRGPNVMQEYLKNPTATAAALTPDGWLRSGDLGFIDDDGYVFVSGRLKELIIKGGENIAPREVDEALYAHGDVVEAAAFARPCPTYGETVEAAVRLRDGSQADAATLLVLCRDRLGQFKTPDVIHFMAELPKGPSGKIQRLKLAELTDPTALDG